MAINNNFKQSHFVLYELVLPYCSVCTPVGELTESWHTPVTCEEVSDQEYSLWFASNSAPIMQPPSTSINVQSRLNSSVWRVVQNGSETTPTIKPGEGMASRGTMSVTMADFKGDPGPINFSDDGTFFGKLKARNILDGKKIITHYYSITQDSAAPEEVNTSTHYIESSNLTGGKFTIKAKDALKDLEAFSQQFPVPTEVELVADIDASVVTFEVTDGSKFAADDVIIIDKELMRIQSVLGNDITVSTRGTTQVAIDGGIIYKTNVASHSAESSVQICYVMSKTFLSDVLQDVFNGVGLGAYVNYTQWNDEILEWNSNAYLYGVFHEPEEADDLINRLLSNYMVDMWLDQSTQKALVSATSVWKQSIRTISEESDLTDLKVSTKSDTRYSRAYIYNQKDFQAENDDAVNYSRLTLFKDTATETDDFYGSIKLKEFDPSNFISKGSAEILVSRYVQRYSKTPEALDFKMEERKLAGLGLGDVVDVVSRSSQTASGEYLQARVRAQLISIKPNLNDVGRYYNVKTLSYVPLIATSPTGDLLISFSGKENNINIYTRAGAPPDAVNITCVFDGSEIGSGEVARPSITAGNLAPGSTLKLIFTNNSKVSSIGGNGGDAYNINSSPFTFTTDGTDGGDIYQSNGIATEIYLNYGTVDGYVTDCEFYAAGGGGAAAAGSAVVTNGFNDAQAASAAGGGGGSGIPAGFGGEAVSNLPATVNAKRQGVDGTFNSGGSGGPASAYDISLPGAPAPQAEVRVTATSGPGGFSLDGGAATATINIISGSSISSRTSTSSNGLEGAAIKGTGVTVYNLAASASKFRDGNSDSYTLITA